MKAKTANQTQEVPALLTIEEVEKVCNNVFTPEQMAFLTEKTPESEIYQKVKNGKNYRYVKGSYVKKVLNLMFGFAWTEQIISKEYYPEFNQVVVNLRLCYTGKDGREYFKEQFGGADLEEGKPSLGDAFKAAATDALKKCASELGIAADVYGADDLQKTVLTDEEKAEKIKSLIKDVQDKGIKIVQGDAVFLNRILEEKETKSYDKAIAQLQKKLTTKK